MVVIHWWNGRSKDIESAAQDGRRSGIVWRTRFEPFWSKLPRLTVLSAVPGAGKRTWMLQCAHYVSEHFPETAILWKTAGQQLGEAADVAHSAEERPVLCFTDGRFLADDFWDNLRQTMNSRPWLRVVVTCFDEPSNEDLGISDVVCLDEEILAFEPTEREAVNALLREEGAPPNIRVPGREEDGFAYLIGLVIEETLLGNRAAADALTNAEGGVQVAKLLLEGPHAYAFSLSKTANVLRAGRDLYWLTPELVSETAGSLTRAQRIVDRLGNLPLFDVYTNVETGGTQLVWRDAVWQHIVAVESPGDAEARRRRSLDRLRSVGSVTGQLLVFLELGDYESAERLVCASFRRLMLQTGPLTARFLRRASTLDPSATPALTLLRCELLMQECGVRAAIRADAVQATKRLRLDIRDNIADEIAHTGLLAYGLVLAGDREGVGRQIEHMLELVAGRDWGPPKDGAAESGKEFLEKVSGGLYLSFFAALQSEMLTEALQIGAALDVWSSPNEAVRWADIIALDGARDMAGLCSLTEDKTRNYRDHHYEGIAWSSIEQGNDAEAVISLRPVLAMGLGTMPQPLTRTLITQVFVIAAPTDLDLERLERMLEASTKVWSDGRVGSLLVWAATLAFATLGALDRAEVWIAKLDSVDDIGARLARATYYLWTGQALEARRELADVDEPLLPRITVIAGVLGVAAAAVLGGEQQASHRLEALWREYPYPRLFRYAFRLIPQDVFDVILQDATNVSPLVRGVLADSENDHRTAKWQTRPHLTDTEREILELLSLGMSNREIAERRFVTIGTVRSQLKSLYRKLDVVGRVEAVKVATRFHLI